MIGSTFIRFAGLAILLSLAVPRALSADRLAPESLAYVLQTDGLARNRDDAVAQLARCDRDLIVIDYSYDGSQTGKWTGGEIETMRSGKSGRKVLAYISVGEAEDYRFYWNTEWDKNRDGRPDQGAPSFLNDENPDWEGNYKVRYWQESWQQIILKYVDEVIGQGFDGCYLDIVDAFEFYEYHNKDKGWVGNRANPETGRTYRRDMVEWIRRIAVHARRLKPGFLIIPQNGVQLLEHRDYMTTIDGVGVEDLFTNGKRKQSSQDVGLRLRFLGLIHETGKPVLVIEYCKNRKLQEYSIGEARRHGFVILLTERDLKCLGTATNWTKSEYDTEPSATSGGVRG